MNFTQGVSESSTHFSANSVSKIPTAFSGWRCKIKVMEAIVGLSLLSDLIKYISFSARDDDAQVK